MYLQFRSAPSARLELDQLLKLRELLILNSVVHQSQTVKDSKQIRYGKRKKTPAKQPVSRHTAKSKQFESINY